MHQRCIQPLDLKLGSPKSTARSMQETLPLSGVESQAAELKPSWGKAQRKNKKIDPDVQQPLFFPVFLHAGKLATSSHSYAGTQNAYRRDEVSASSCFSLSR